MTKSTIVKNAILEVLSDGLPHKRAEIIAYINHAYPETLEQLNPNAVSMGIRRLTISGKVSRHEKG